MKSFEENLLAYRQAQSAVIVAREEFEKALEEVQSTCKHTKVHEAKRFRFGNGVKVRACGECGVVERTYGKFFNVLPTQFVKVVDMSIIITISENWKCPF